MSLDIGLPVDELAAPIRACLAAGEEVARDLACTNRRGTAITCKAFVKPVRTASAAESGGVILFLEIRGRASP